MGHGVHIQVIIPTFKPDALFRLAAASLSENLHQSMVCQ